MGVWCLGWCGGCVVCLGWCGGCVVGVSVQLLWRLCANVIDNLLH